MIETAVNVSTQIHPTTSNDEILREKDKEIQSLKIKVDSLEQTIQTTNSQIAHAKQKSKNLETELQQKELELAECGTQINSMVTGSLICHDYFLFTLKFLFK